MNVIIFDVDGVLLEADSPELDTFVEAFMECEETKVTNTDWSSYVSRTDIGVTEEILRAVSDSGRTTRSAVSRAACRTNTGSKT